MAASSSPVPARPDSIAESMAATSNGLPVLNTAAALPLLPTARATAGHGNPATTGVAAGNTMVAPARAPGGQPDRTTLELLMRFAGWNHHQPWAPSYNGMSPLALPPSAATSPASFASGATAGANGGGGAGADRYDPGRPGSSGAGRGKPRDDARPLQITAATGSSSSTSKTKSSPPPLAGDDDHERLAPVLAMPTPQGKVAVAAAAANGRRVRLRERAPKDDGVVGGNGSRGKPPPPSRKTRLRSAAPAPPPAAGNGRKRKHNTSAAPPPRLSSLSAGNAAAPPAAAASKKHTILTWLIDGGFLSDGETVFYAPGEDDGGGAGKVVSGAATLTGVHCSCCDAVLPLPAFEAHAGGQRVPGQQPQQRQAWEKLLLESGDSLLQRMQEGWETELVRIFHAQDKVRAALEEEDERNSLAKKRMLLKHQKKRVVVVERIMSARMMERMKAGEKDSSDDACGICADGGKLLCCDSCLSTFHPKCLAMEVPEGSWSCHYCRCTLCMSTDDQGLSTCQQCGQKYHESCRPLPGNGRDIGAYCSETCKKLSAQLPEVTGITNHTEDGFSWALLRLQKDEPASSQEMPVVLERNVKLAVALGVLNECFNPMKDRRTKIDMLHQAVYSLRSEYKRLSYEGFYTMVLEKDGEIVSVALLRIHGRKVAEMPFAATLPAYRKQGMMRRLVSAVEQVLASVQVEKLMIPAIDYLVDTWTRSFSFRPMDPQLREELKRLSLLAIKDTTQLYKPVASPPQPPMPPPTSPRQAGSSEAWWRKYADPEARLTDGERAFLEMDADMAPPFRYTDLINSNVSLNTFCRRAGDSSSSAFRAAMSPLGRSISAALALPGPGAGVVQLGTSGAGGWRSCGEAASSAMAPKPPRYPHGGHSGVLHGMK